jgi:hemolysin III
MLELNEIQPLQKIVFLATENARSYIHDSGPLYHEFHAESMIKEPWNAISSLFFLVPVIFWLWKLRGQYRKYPMITFLLPLLFLNGVGSSLYHAFRASQLALLMDWMPAFIMNLILAWYMWKRVLNRPVVSVFVVLGFYVLAILSVVSLAPLLKGMSANVGYLFIGLSLLLPSVIYLIRTNFYKWYLLLISFVFLGIALLFRSLDYPTPNPFPDLLPQGTHFLWHVTSALAVFSLGYYLKYIRDLNPEKKNESR